MARGFGCNLLKVHLLSCWFLDCDPFCGPHMRTVQLAIRDSDYAQNLRGLLLRDGIHRVHVVERPDLLEDGVVSLGGWYPARGF